MRARIKWLDHKSFVGESGSGHSVVMDGAPDSGGRDLGVRPMEMVLLGLGGCSAFDVISILQKSRQAVSDCEVHLEAERADSRARRVTCAKFSKTFSLRRNSLSKVFQATRRRSSESICSSSDLMNASVRFLCLLAWWRSSLMRHQCRAWSARQRWL